MQILCLQFIFDGYHKRPHDYNEILLGIIAFLVAMLVIFIIDNYHQKVRELELRSINANLQNVQIPPQSLNYNDYIMNSNIIDEKVEAVIKEELKKALMEE